MRLSPADDNLRRGLILRGRRSAPDTARSTDTLGDEVSPDLQSHACQALRQKARVGGHLVDPFLDAGPDASQPYPQLVL